MTVSLPTNIPTVFNQGKDQVTAGATSIVDPFVKAPK